MKYKYLILIIICFLGSLIFNDIEDVLQFHYEESIFYCGQDCFWSDTNKDAGKAWWMAKWMYDGWHFAKVCRQWLTYVNIPWLILFAIGFRFRKYGHYWSLEYGANSYNPRHIRTFKLRPLYLYLILMFVVEVVLYVMHASFYGTMFRV